MNCINCSNPLLNHSHIIEPKAGEKPVLPHEGDITFCSRCGTLYEFDMHLKLRPLSETEEREILSEDIDLAMICYRLRAAIKDRIDGN